MPPIFITKGHLSPERDAAVYMTRDADEKLLRYVQRGNYVALLGARQTGKTSLLYMLRHKLKVQGTPVAFVDLSGAMGKPEGWYRYLCRCILDELGISQKRQQALLQDADPSQFDEFLKAVAREIEAGQIVVLFDER